MSYLITQIFKDAEEDSFNYGYIGNGNECLIEYKIQAYSKEELLTEFKNFCGRKEVEINPCKDDPSRIECARMENKYGEEPVNDEIAEWKAGNINLYYVVYTAYVKKYEPANMEE